MAPLAAVLAVSLFVPLVSAADAPKPKDMVCGAVTAEDIQEIFDVILHYSGYDNNLDDQKPWGKPRRGKTTGIFKSDEASLKAVAGSPAAAFAANTGLNRGGPMSGASHVFIHIPSMADMNQSRAEAAFILAHEISHLVMHHPEQLEKHNMDSFMAWCESRLEFCSSADTQRIVAAWDRATVDERNAFMRKIEAEADREARQWMTTVPDPRTGRTFAADGGEEALKSAEQWLKATQGDVLADDPAHGSLASRIEVLRRDREQMGQSRTAGLEGKAEAVKSAVGGF
jgi:hypothetical protein